MKAFEKLKAFFSGAVEERVVLEAADKVNGATLVLFDAALFHDEALPWFRIESADGPWKLLEKERLEVLHGEENALVLLYHTLDHGEPVEFQFRFLKVKSHVQIS